MRRQTFQIISNRVFPRVRGNNQAGDDLEVICVLNGGDTIAP